MNTLYPSINGIKGLFELGIGLLLFTVTVFFCHDDMEGGYQLIACLKKREIKKYIKTYSFEKIKTLLYKKKHCYCRWLDDVFNWGVTPPCNYTNYDKCAEYLYAVGALDDYSTTEFWLAANHPLYLWATIKTELKKENKHMPCYSAFYFLYKKTNLATSDERVIANLKKEIESLHD